MIYWSQIVECVGEDPHCQDLEMYILIAAVHIQFAFIKGPRTVSYSICPNFDSLWLAYCKTDNNSFMLK